MELINCLQLTVDAYSVQRSIAESKPAKVKMEKMFVESPRHLIVHPKVDPDGQLSTELLRLESILPKVCFCFLFQICIQSDTLDLPVLLFNLPGFFR